MMKKSTKCRTRRTFSAILDFTSIYNEMYNSKLKTCLQSN